MKLYFIILLFICCVFSACDLTGSSNYTPQITFLHIAQLNSKDTLKINYTDESGVLKLDSISVGDTVTLRVLLNGFTNNLVSFMILRSDTVSSKLILPDKNSLDSVFNSSLSNYSKAKFNFRANIPYMGFQFKYIAVKESSDAKISFALLSDANFNGSAFDGSNYVSYVLKTPIKKAKILLLN